MNLPRIYSNNNYTNKNLPHFEVPKNDFLLPVMAIIFGEIHIDHQKFLSKYVINTIWVNQVM